MKLKDRFTRSTHVCKHTRNTSRGTSVREENAKVTDTIAFGETNDSKSNNDHAGLNCEPWGTELGLVRQRGEDVDRNSLEKM